MDDYTDMQSILQLCVIWNPSHMRAFRIVCVVIFSLAFAHSASADHILGGNISYECVGGDDYLITLTVYRDCFFSTAALPEENIFFFPSGCGELAFSSPLQLQSVTEISQLCPSELPNSSCSGGFNPGTQRVIYQNTLTLAAGCVWQIEFGSAEWNNFANVNNSLQPFAYISATLDTNFGCNSSVSVTSDPVPYACVGDAVSHTLSFDNPDGHTIVVTHTGTETASGIDVPYQAGYSAAEPIPGFTFDPTTLEMAFTAPNTLGTYVVSFEVEMFDAMGNLVGVFNEAMTFVVRLCDSLPTYFDVAPVVLDQADANLTGPTSLEACVGDSVCFSVQAINDNLFRSVTVSSTNLLALFPSASFNSSPGNPGELEICIIPTAADIGIHVLDFDAIDDDCINPSSDDLTVDVTIHPQLNLAFTDSLLCAEENLVLVAEGDTDFTWNVLSGTASPGIVGTGGTQDIVPETDMVIEVTANNAPMSCAQTGTVNIQVALSDLGETITDESCVQNDGQIDLNVSGGTGSYSYTWADDPAATTSLTGLVAGDYTVTIADDGVQNCSLTETFTVGSSPPPMGMISGDTTICAGDSYEIPVALAGTGPFTVVVNGVSYAGLQDGDSVEVTPASTTTYTLESVEDGNIPACQYLVTSSLTVAVRETPSASLSGTSPVCAGQSTNLMVSATPTGTALNLTGSDPAISGTFSDGDVVSVTPTGPSTTYALTQVAYSDAPNCAASVSSDLTIAVDPLPTGALSFSNPTPICPGDAVILTFTLTGTGPWDVAYSIDGVAQPIYNTSFGTSDLLIANGPNVDADFCITSITDLGTGCVNTDSSCELLEVYPSETATFSANGNYCEGDDISATLILSGAGTLTELVVEGPAGNLNTITGNFVDGDSFPLDGITAGEYCIVEITTMDGCTFTQSECVTIATEPLPTVDVTGSAAICVGEDYAFTWTTLSGTPPFNVNWELYNANSNALVDSGTELGINNGDDLLLSPTEDAYLVVSGLTDSSVGNCSGGAQTGQFDLTVNAFSELTLLSDTVLCTGGIVELTFLFEQFVGPNLTASIDNGQNIGIVSGLVAADGTYDFIPMYDTSVPGSGTLTISNFQDSGNPCSTILVDNISIEVVEVPTASLAADATICPGESVDLELTAPAAGGPYDVFILTDNAEPDIVLNGIVGNQTITVAPAETTVFTLDSIAEVVSLAGCNSQPNQPVTITVSDLPTIVQPYDTLCANTGDVFQISFEITGGDPSTYNVSTLGGLGGTITSVPPYIYTSNTMPDNTGETWSLSDGSGCPHETITIAPFDCPILTFAGTVDVTPIDICADETFSILQFGDEVLDGNDVLSYALLDDCDFATATVLDLQNGNTWDSSADLSFPPLNYDQTYYVVALAGDDDGSGLVNLASPTLNVSDCVPVTIHEIPTATLSGDATICANTTTPLQVDFTGAGPWDFSYFDPITGTVDLVGITGADNPLISDVSNAGVYTPLSVSSYGCIGTVNGTATVTVNPLPTALLSAGGEICANEQYAFDIDLTGTPNWDLELAFDDGTVVTTDVVSAIDLTASPFTWTVDQAGTYSVTSVTDGNGCSNANPSNAEALVVNPLPTASWPNAQEAYCAGSDVDLQLDLTGTADYTISYTLDGALQPDWTSVTNTYIEQNVSATGAYTVTAVTDGNGCMALLNETVEVVEVPLPAADAGEDANVCSDVPVPLGTPAIAGNDYSWSVLPGVVGDLLNNSAAAEPTATITNLDSPNIATFTFTVTVTEPIASCQSTDDVTVTINPIPSADAGMDQLLCFGDVFELQGSGDGDCEWTDNGSIEPLELTNCTATTLALTSTTAFDLTVTNAAGCTNTAQVTLSIPAELTETATFDASVCFETCDAAIEVEPSGGWGNYTISGDLSDFENENLCSDTYDYTVTDEEGCSVTGQVVIDELPEYFITDVNVTQPNCYQDTNGEIEIIAAGGVEYQFNGEVSLTNTFTGLGVVDNPGMVQVTDFNGCVAETTVTFVENSPEITISTNFSSTTICVNEPVVFEPEALGGSGIFQYNWYQDNPPPGAIYATGSPLVQNLDQELSLYVVAFDENGCPSDTLLMEALFDSPVTVVATPEVAPTICNGACVDISALAAGGSNPITVTWFESGLFGEEEIGTDPNYTLCPEVNTTYIVYADDGCAPVVSATVDVVVNQPPDIALEADTLSGCFPLTVSFANTSPNVTDNTCFWNFGDGTTLPICEDVTYTYTGPGSFMPVLTMTSPFGCSASDSLLAPIEVHGYPETSFYWTPEDVTTLENVVEFVNTTPGDNQYIWDVSGGFGTFPGEQLELEFPPIDLSTYDVCLEAINAFGCADTLCQSFTMESILLVHVPNSFTPNNDGINDVFFPVLLGADPTFYTFRVWDRWGDIIFETNDVNEGWDGTNKSNEYYVQNDVYVWQIETRDFNTADLRRFFGNVTIIR